MRETVTLRHFIVLVAILATACTATPTQAPPPAPTASPTLLAETPAPTQTTPAEQPGPLDPLEIARSFNPLPAMAHIEDLTSEPYDGRRSGTQGEREAAEYLAERMAALGLAPVGDGDTYFQRFEIDFRELAAQPILEITQADDTTRSFRLRVDFREYVFGPVGPGTAEGELVYAVRGTAADLRGMPLAGNIVLVDAEEGPVNIGAVADRVQGAGGEGLLILTDNRDALRVKGSYLQTSPHTIPVFLAGPAVAEAVAEAGGFAPSMLGQDPFPTGVQARMELSLVDQRVAASQNVVGLLPGTDPDLDDLVVIIGGHYDHVGRDPDGTLFPGANDNASGISVALAVAQHLIDAGFWPRASLMFVGWGSEEAGLVGSQYYAANPVFPLEDTLAVINLDVVGQGRGDGVDITETSGPLEELLAAWAEDLGIAASTIPDHGASDQAVFNQRAVPASHLGWKGFDGLIHVSADTFDQIDVLKIQSVGRLVTLAAMELASEPSLVRQLAFVPDRPIAFNST